MKPPRAVPALCLTIQCHVPFSVFRSGVCVLFVCGTVAEVCKMSDVSRIQSPHGDFYDGKVGLTQVVVCVRITMLYCENTYIENV